MNPLVSIVRNWSLLACAQVASSAIALVFMVFISRRLGQGATAVASVLVLAAALRVLFQLIQLRRLDGLRMSGQRAPAVDVLLRGGLPFLAAQTLGLFVAKVDVPILGRLSGEAAVGWYAASSRLMEASNFVPVVLLIAMFPVLSRLWVQSPSEFQITVRKTLHFLLILTVPVTVTLFVLSQEIIGFFFTLRSYAPAVPILRVQAFSIGLIFVDYLLTCVLMAAGRERVWLAIVGAACVLNPALNFVLIPAFDLSSANGAIGAAIATLITEVFILVCALRAMPSGILGLESARVALRAAALGIGFAAVLFAGRTVGIPWVLALAVGGAMYLAAAQGFGLLPAELTAWVRSVVSRRAVVSSAGGEDAGAKLPREVDAA